MKRLGVLSLVFCLSVTLSGTPVAAAWDEYDDSQSHPLRVLAYLIHPVAFALEWTVFRPLHFLVSATPAQEALFGHTPHPTVLTEPDTVNPATLNPVAGNRAAVRPVTPLEPPVQ